MSEKVFNLAVFDDAEDYVDCLRRTLEFHGYKITITASSVVAAIGMIQSLSQEKLLAILIDKQFPDGYGDYIVEQLKAQKIETPLIGIGSMHKVEGVRENIFKPDIPKQLVGYLETLK